MSFQALTWAVRQKCGGITGKAILLAIEATIRGVLPARSLDDVRQAIEANPRTLRNGLKRLSKAGIIVVTRSPEAVEIACEAGVLRLHPFSGEQRPEGWEVERSRVFREKGFACEYCGDVATQVDHVIARTRGGPDHFDNLVPCCAPCNLSKGNRPLSSWSGRA